MFIIFYNLTLYYYAYHLGVVCWPNFKQLLNSTSPATEDDGAGLEVVCVGLSSTGTSSLKAALSIILPGKTFHAMDFLNGINDEVRFM